MRELLFAQASGKVLHRNPPCSVYVAKDTGPSGEHLTKDRTRTRCSSAVCSLYRSPRGGSKCWRYWCFSSIAEATEREAETRKNYDPFIGDGGREWVRANAEEVVADLTRMWGDRERR